MKEMIPFPNKGTDIHSTSSLNGVHGTTKQYDTKLTELATLLRKLELATRMTMEDEECTAFDICVNELARSAVASIDRLGHVFEGNILAMLGKYITFSHAVKLAQERRVRSVCSKKGNEDFIAEVEEDLDNLIDNLHSNAMYHLSSKNLF